MTCRYTHKGRNEYSHHQRDDVRPDWEGNVPLDDDDETENKTDDKHDSIPPPRGILVMLGHVHVVSIFVTARPCALVCLGDVFTPKEEAVGNQGADLENA